MLAAAEKGLDATPFVAVSIAEAAILRHVLTQRFSIIINLLRRRVFVPKCPLAIIIR